MSSFLALLGLVVLAVMIVVSVTARRQSRDEIFEGVTPGLLPLKGQEVGRKRLRGLEYSGPIAVQFAPPRDVAPGLVGTIVDGKAEMRDVTATIVDLAVRGFLTIKTVPLLGDTALETAHDAPVGQEGPQTRPKKAKQDWLLTADPNPPSEVRPFERSLLRAMFGQGPTVRMSDLQHGFGAAMREAQVDLYRQVVDNGWYPRHPLAKGGKLRMWGGVLLALGVLSALAVLWAIGASTTVTPVAILLPLGLVVGGIIGLVAGRGVRVGRTAEGTAIMIQSLGFKKYLATAEAHQIKFEEASEIFSRYLPYAIVFGVAEHWAKVFGDVAKRYQEMRGGNTDFGDYTATDLMFDLMWFDFMTPDLHFGGDADLFAMGGAFSGGGFDLPDFGDVLGDIGEGAGEVFGAFTEGVSGFVDSAGGFEMPDLDGCDLDGCDLG